MFIHWLVWDDSYSGYFLKDLITALFDITTYCQYVILVMPPRVTPADMFKLEMTRIRAKNVRDFRAGQSLYIGDRNRFRQKLKIRRVVEEDNDDVVSIIADEAILLKELYGEYYVSKMVRYPDDCRQLIIGEDVDGSAVGVMCLNSTIDIDLLNENFELTACHGLRKPHENDEELVDVIESTSELLVRTISPQMSYKYTAGPSDQSLKELNEEDPHANTLERNASTKCEESSQREIEIDNVDDLRQTSRDVETITRDPVKSMDAGVASRSSESGELHKLHLDQIAKPNVSSLDNSRLVSAADLSSNDVDVQFQSKMQASTLLAEAMLELRHKRNALPVVEDEKTAQLRLIHDLLPRSMYHGGKNAFVLEIFATHDGMKPHWSLDFLEAAFDSFPDLDYCVILLPSSHPPCQFLQHFVRVPFRCNRDFPMMLYVLHRALLFGEIKCRRAQVRDRNTLQGLLAAMPTKHETLADFDLAMDPLQLDLDCFVFECNDTMLGLAILRAEKQVDFVRSRYHVEDHVSMQSIHQDDYGHLLHFVLTPIFLVYNRFFFREIARLSGLTVIFYRLHHEDESALTRKCPLASCLGNMVAVNPRKQAGYKFPDTSGKIDTTENDTTDNDMFSLFMTSPRLAMMPPAIVDLRIIVVGASDCGVALVEHFVLRSSCRYTNFTLISPHGLPFDKKLSYAETSLLPFRGRFCSEYRRCVTLRTWINVVYGTMTAISRREKYVTVMNQGNLTYDYLILTCGLQYQRPTLRGETKTQKGRGKATVESQIKLPWNCLTINDDTEASVCLKKIRCSTKDLTEERAILFYGRNIDCYCALRALIEFGVNPSWITLIEPNLNSSETCNDVFCNREVDEAVTNAVLRSGVQVLSGWCMIDWITREANGQIAIESVTIEKGGERRTMVCDVLLNFDEKTINLNAFLAFCRAGLVFDGSLIIDPECRTNDPFIFAAGTVTKHSRKFRAESSQHIYFSSVEIGERFAKILRRVIDIQRGNGKTSQLWEEGKTSSTSPVFRAPVVIACILPGDYYYLHGEIFVTGSCTSEIGYFRIQLNSYDSVDTVTCVSKKPFEVQDMIALCGKHESMLNELKFRFKKSSISDFYAYFREPWAAAIFHDRFECMRVENRAALLSRTRASSDYLVDDCVRASMKSNISEQDRHYIESRYAGSVYHRELENNLIRFLEFYESELPMYWTPHKQRQMYMDIEESPLYFTQ